MKTKLYKKYQGMNIPSQLTAPCCCNQRLNRKKADRGGNDFENWPTNRDASFTSFVKHLHLIVTQEEKIR